MKLKPIGMRDWPKLAWVAVGPRAGGELCVYHGPMVEIGAEWMVEAVWAGEFAAGDFDRTELVFGSGIRVRGDKVIFVTAGTTLDRLCYAARAEKYVFANSLPALLAVLDESLAGDYRHYARDIGSMMLGLDQYCPVLPATGGEITQVYYHNFEWDGRSVSRRPKPETTPNFASYADYWAFVQDVARRLGRNLAAAERQFAVQPLSSISSGYDSSAAAVISRFSGCTRTVTIAESTSFWRGSDSGAPIARRLGMECIEYPRQAREYPDEEAFWAADPNTGIQNWSLFDYPAPLCLFFTGCHGEKMWDRVNHDHPDPFVRRDTAALGFCEYRLIKGVFQCVVPFWGVRRSHQLRSITAAEEMKPWYTGKDYDKPIARRILQEAGIEGRLFGQLKKNTVLNSRLTWPLSARTQADFHDFLRQGGHWRAGQLTTKILHKLAHLHTLIDINLARPFKLNLGSSKWRAMPMRDLIFLWATAIMKKRYYLMESGPGGGGAAGGKFNQSEGVFPLGAPRE